MVHSEESNISLGVLALVKRAQEPGAKGMKYSDKQREDLGKAIAMARRDMNDIVMMPDSSREEANAHLAMAEGAYENMNFDRANHHYGKARGIIGSFAPI